MFPGPYRIPALRVPQPRSCPPTRATYVSYRGPWAVETFVRERMLDVIARELGLSRAEIRRRNLIGADELPDRPWSPARPSTCGCRPSAGSSRRPWSWPASTTGKRTKAEARAAGRRLGLGFATYIEAAPGPPDYLDHIAPGFTPLANCEPIHAVLEADGTVTVHTQQVPHGQGHETTLAQLAADELGVPIDAVRIRYGDTRTAPFGLVGTAGSRAATMASGAVLPGHRGTSGTGSSTSPPTCSRPPPTTS